MGSNPAVDAQVIEKQDAGQSQRQAAAACALKKGSWQMWVRKAYLACRVAQWPIDATASSDGVSVGQPEGPQSVQGCNCTHSQINLAVSAERTRPLALRYPRACVPLVLGSSVSDLRSCMLSNARL